MCFLRPGRVRSQGGTPRRCQGNLDVGGESYLGIYIYISNVILQISHMKRWSRLINQLLCNYVDHCASVQCPKYIVRHALVSVQKRVPHVEGHLRRAWKCFDNWALNTPIKSRVPCPETCLKAIFVQCLAMGLESSADARYFISGAIVCATGFYGILRPCELLQIRRQGGPWCAVFTCPPILV